MSVSQFNVSKALNDQLNTIESATLPVVPQGGTSAPTDGSQYLRSFLLSSEERVEDLSTGSRQNGVFQIDVLTPKSNGQWGNLDLVDTVKAVFVQAETYSSGGTDVKIRWVSTSSIREDGQYFITSISVNYATFGA